MKSDNENKKPLDIQDDGGENGEGKKADGGTGIALGICFGCAFGLLVQVITGDIIWLPIGVAVGCSLGLTIGSIGKKDK